MNHGQDTGESSGEERSRITEAGPEAERRSAGTPAAADRDYKSAEVGQRRSPASSGLEDDGSALARRADAERIDEPVDGVLEDPERNPTGYLLQAEHWSAPAPSPKAIQGYENISEGLGLRAFAMAEKALDTQNAVTASMVDADVTTVKRGQWMSYSLMVLCVVGAVVLAILGKTVVAVALLGYPVFQGASKLVRTVRDRPSDMNEPTEADE